MNLFKEWMAICENASKILAKDPGNPTAEQIRNLAASSLVQANYPVEYDRAGRLKMEVGDYCFLLEEDAYPSKEALQKRKDEMLAKAEREKEEFRQYIWDLEDGVTPEEPKAEPAVSEEPEANAPEEIQEEKTEEEPKEEVSVPVMESAPAPENETQEEDILDSFCFGGADGPVPEVPEEAEEIPGYEAPSAEPEASAPTIKKDEEKAIESTPEEISEHPTAPVPESAPATEPLKMVQKGKFQVMESKSDGITPIEVEDVKPAGATIPLSAAPVVDENATRPLYVAPKANQADAGYVDHMRSQDLLVNFHDVTIRNEQGMVLNFQLMLSPMSVKERETDFLLWASDGAKRAQVLRSNEEGIVRVAFGSIVLEVKGVVFDDAFHSAVLLPKEMQDAGLTIETKDCVRKGLGHLKVEDEGIEIRLVPIEPINKRTGDATYFYMISQDGQPDQFGETSLTDHAYFEYRGERMELLARWRSEVLYSSVIPV